MGKQRQSALILGEGPTEFYYFKSLCDVYKRIDIKPDSPKHTNLKELDKKIKEGIDLGYRYVFCIIDMDTKDEKNESAQYKNLKKKYAETVNKPKKGICCDVKFIETHRCTELFFLYYFRYTTRPYQNQDSLLMDLNNSVKYEKNIEFFKRCRGLHGYFERNGGRLVNAIANAEQSMKEVVAGNRSYTFSELGHLMNVLNDI